MTNCTAFAGPRRIASGAPSHVAVAVKAAIDAGEIEPILVFDNATSRLLEFDLRGSPTEVAARFAPHEGADEAATSARGPGRPKLGVVAREVTLLPRHWDWLNAQPGGASVALRKLVEVARKDNAKADLIRIACETTDRFIAATAGNSPGYEEATRALYGCDRAKFAAMTESWSIDIRDHARRLAAPAFAELETATVP